MMNRQEMMILTKKLSETAENRWTIIVSIPSGMSEIDAMMLIGNLRVRLWLVDTPVKITIHEGKYMVFALSEKLKEDKYMEEFLRMSLEDYNCINNIYEIK